MYLADELGQGDLCERWRESIEDALCHHEAIAETIGHDGVGQAQTGKHRLAKASGVQDDAAPVERLQRRHGAALVAELAVVVVFDDPGPTLLTYPGIAPVAELAEMGVRRLSVGPKLAFAAMMAAKRVCAELFAQGTCTRLFDSELEYAAVNSFFASTDPRSAR
ncbi:MAG: putative carboxyvinyl-carboxyphosphonate phosphorylmutase [Labilithrix sp.]|nr:putative carboxyvinyl-carboxyphosphonate phosphorylmutase [Labilithrix sp.]